MQHLVLECLAHQGLRPRRWGPTLTIEEVLSEEATKIWPCIQETSRIPRDPA